MWNTDTGEDTKCPVIEPMCQTLAPEVGRLDIGAMTDVEHGHWGGHQVSGHRTDVSNHVL